MARSADEHCLIIIIKIIILIIQLSTVGADKNKVKRSKKAK